MGMQPAIQLHQPIEISYRNHAPMRGAEFHSHPFFEIYYFQGGDCHYLIGDELMALQPGDLILMHGMTLHCANPGPNVPYVRSIIHFDPGYVHRMLQPETATFLLQPFEELRNIRLPLGETDRAEFERLLFDLNELNVRRGGNEAALTGDVAGWHRFSMRFFELLSLIRGWCAGPVEAREHPSSKVQHVQSAISYLENHYDEEELTLSDVAGALHLTKPYLSNLFKEVTGTTVFNYLYNRRLNQAKMMFFIDPSRPVSDVCRTVGFKHPAHFSRLFKAAVGLGPEAYRRRMRHPSPL
jgi:AraC-like DNA-binding protein